ncbi:MAG: hypothetical protein QNJ09_10320 [Paracoccaceae bacterium]|nr:hypothetical protein [Paracoccaceae bacterium]
MLRSAALLAPFTLTAPLSTGIYWSPDRLFGWPVGIEDLVFSLGYGVITWGFARMVAGPLPLLRPLNARFVKRALIAGVVGGLILAASLMIDLSFGLASLFSHGAVIAMILFARPVLIKVAVPAALLLGVFYVCGMALTIPVLGPAFVQLWSHEHIFGPLLLGLPIEEYLWMISFAAAWLCVLLWASDYRGGSARV